MIQKKYICKDFHTAEDAIGQIADKISHTQHRAALVTIYETGFSTREMESLIEQLKGYGFPELQIAGISLTIVASLMPEGTGALINLVLTEEANIEVVTIPCMPGEERQAAGRLRFRLDACR